MQIIDIKASKTCLDKSAVKIVTMDKNITRDTLKIFQELGELKIYDFMNPLYVVKNPDCWEIKGLLNDSKFKVTLYQDEWKNLLLKLIKSLN